MFFFFLQFNCLRTGSRRAIPVRSVRIRIQNIGLLLSFKIFRSFYRPLQNYERRSLIWSSSLPSPPSQVSGTFLCVPSLVKSSLFFFFVESALKSNDEKIFCLEILLPLLWIRGELFQNPNPTSLPHYSGTGDYIDKS